MLNYKAIAIFASAQARGGKQPVAEAVVHFLRGRKIAARLPHSSVFTGLPAADAQKRPVGLMLEGDLKRRPVLDADGRFKGMSSRDSLLRTGFGGPT
jgi:hypothetical protein